MSDLNPPAEGARHQASGGASAAWMEKVEQMRPVGLYGGPIIFASFAANGLYGVACHERSFTLSPGTQPPVIIAPFLIFAVILAWRVKEPLGRSAFAIYALHEAVLGYAALSGVAPNREVIGFLLLASTTLFMAFGARGATPRRLALAGGVFVVAFLLSWGVHYYADVVIGRHSVLSGPMCSIADRRFAA